mmetsp:Transcript_31639/g.63199  ORF Transcript_31639/g.63199 Transcript_31639/m.63199 type:complete len:218 (-) Transcript_31639:282-935(-)
MVRMLASDVVQTEVLFHALDVGDDAAVPIVDILLFGGTLGAHWTSSSWTVERCTKVAGAAEGTTTFDKAQFIAFMSGVNAVQPWEVDAEELRALVDGQLCARNQMTPHSDDIIDDAFDAIDLDDSGLIDLDELLHFGSSVGANWTPAFCASLLGRMDTNGNGGISRDEFAAFLQTAGLHGCHDEVTAFIRAGTMRQAAAAMRDPTARQDAEDAEDAD